MNEVTLMGNLGQDPQLRNQVCKFPLATKESWIDKKTNERKDHTEWHRITLFGKLAELNAKYLSKGSRVIIKGKLKTTKYDKEGQTHWSTEIIANRVLWLDTKEQAEKRKSSSNENSEQVHDNSNYEPESSFEDDDFVESPDDQIPF